MVSYVSSLDSNKKQSALNTCLKSLNNMLDYHEFQEEKQNYTELTYNGTVSTLSDIEIKFPRKVGTTIPILGMVMGTIPVIVGYTDGTSIDTSTTFMNLLNRTETDFKVETELVEEEGEGSTTKSFEVKNEANGLRIDETIYTTIEYITVDDEDTGEPLYIIKYTYYQIIREYDYNKCNITVMERF